MLEPVYDFQHYYFSNPDTRHLYDDTPLQSVARGGWIPLGTLLGPRAEAHTYHGIRPSSKGPTNSLAQAVLEVVRPGPLPGNYPNHADATVTQHRLFLRQNPGALGWAKAWPTLVGDPRWAPAQALEARWREFLFRSHPVRYEYIDLPRICSDKMYDYDGPDPRTFEQRAPLVEPARVAANRLYPERHLADFLVMPLAVPRSTRGQGLPGAPPQEHGDVGLGGARAPLAPEPGGPGRVGPQGTPPPGGPPGVPR